MPENPNFINTSPLLYLHQVGQLLILPKLYGTIIAPAAVEQELFVGRERGINVPNHCEIKNKRNVANSNDCSNHIRTGRGN